MKELSAKAEARFDSYLRDVSSSLAGCVTIDPAEVGSDVKLHILSALENLPEPISLDDMESVLEALGQPTQWVPVEAVSPWIHLAEQYERHPHDFCFVGISFLALVLSLLFIPLSFWAGTPSLWTSALLLVFTCALSRTTLSMLEARGEEIRILKWLLYPSLVFGYFSATAIIVGIPTMLLHGLNPHMPIEANLFSTASAIAVTGAILPSWIRFFLYPFANGFTRRWLHFACMYFTFLLCPYLAASLGVFYTWLAGW